MNPSNMDKLSSLHLRIISMVDDVMSEALSIVGNLKPMEKHKTIEQDSNEDSSSSSLVKNLCDDPSYFRFSYDDAEMPFIDKVDDESNDHQYDCQIDTQQGK